MCIGPEWLTAIATTVLALCTAAAIFREEIREWFVHPDFDVDFRPKEGDCRLVPMNWATPTDSETTPTHYVRCQIHNTSEKVAALSVQATLLKVEREDAAGEFQIHDVTPSYFQWAHTDESERLFLRQIPPDSKRFLTLGHVFHPQSRPFLPIENDPNRDISEKETLFTMEMHWKSTLKDYLLSPGRYRIYFQISAENSRPHTFLFELNHMGTWFDDERRMYSEGLGLRVTKV